MILGEYEYVPQSKFWNYYLDQKDAVNLLQYEIPKKDRNYLFNKFVTVVNLEKSSYCNRKCDYCPVASLDTKPQIFMKDEYFEIIVNIANQGSTCAGFTF